MYFRVIFITILSVSLNLPILEYAAAEKSSSNNLTSTTVSPKAAPNPSATSDTDTLIKQGAITAAGLSTLILAAAGVSAVRAFVTSTEHINKFIKDFPDLTDTIVRNSIADPKQAQALIQNTIADPEAAQKLIETTIANPEITKKLLEFTIADPKIAQQILADTISDPEKMRENISNAIANISDSSEILKQYLTHASNFNVKNMMTGDFSQAVTPHKTLLNEIEHIDNSEKLESHFEKLHTHIQKKALEQIKDPEMKLSISRYSSNIQKNPSFEDHNNTLMSHPDIKKYIDEYKKLVHLTANSLDNAQFKKNSSRKKEIQEAIENEKEKYNKSFNIISEHQNKVAGYFSSRVSQVHANSEIVRHLSIPRERGREVSGLRNSL